MGLNLDMNGKAIFFATNNINKFNEARMVFAEYKTAVGMLRVKTLEIQSESLEEIAKTSVIDAFKRCHLPVIVEDAGLFVDALNGFPGPYAAYVYKTIGNSGMIKLMENIEDRQATFQSVIAYYSAASKSPICFEGEAKGEITLKERMGNNKSGFGFDPIFKPESSNKTFAEMEIVEKNKHSHRAKALRGFAEWYKANQK
jgi:XTP/dITP diphosphohydrolase